MTISVTELSWAALNVALLECHDQAQLSAWLAASAAEGHITRSMRIYGRYSQVRRTGELAALRAQIGAADPAKVAAANARGRERWKKATKKTRAA